MKTLMKGWVPLLCFAVLVLVACSGEVSPTTGTAGESGSPAGMGSSSMMPGTSGDSMGGTGGTGAVAGLGAAGLGATSGNGGTGAVDQVMCTNDMDCAGRGLACKDCGNGQQSCPTSVCVTGSCRDSFGVCERPPNSCEADTDCGPQGGKCVLCDDGSCATHDCVDGTCQQSCPSTGRACDVTTDCPVIGDQCIKCPSSTKCAMFACVEASCQLVCPSQ